MMNLELERVTYKSGLSVWPVSADSVKVIPQIAHLASESPMERMLPAFLVNYRVIDTALWRWIALVERVLDRFVKHDGHAPDWKTSARWSPR